MVCFLEKIVHNFGSYKTARNTYCLIILIPSGNKLISYTPTLIIIVFNFALEQIMGAT